MAAKTLTERMKGSAQESLRADIRYRRKFVREFEKEIERYPKKASLQANKGIFPGLGRLIAKDG